METRIILTGILRYNNLFLIVKRNEDDKSYPGAQEFPGGHLECGELLIDGLKRELKEEIGFKDDFQFSIIHYFDEIKKLNGNLVHNLEIDFLIDVDKNLIDVKLSDEHSDYKLVRKDSIYLDEFIKEKIANV